MSRFQTKMGGKSVQMQSHVGEKGGSITAPSLPSLPEKLHHPPRRTRAALMLAGLRLICVVETSPLLLQRRALRRWAIAIVVIESLRIQRCRTRSLSLSLLLLLLGEHGRMDIVLLVLAVRE